MSTLLSRLPGDIPGLLRRGSPVIWDGYHGIVIACGDDMCCCAAEDGGATWTEEDMPLSSVTLDLSDPAGRSDAAVWASGVRLTRNERYLCIHALLSPMALDWTDEDTDALARLCLHLAGRTP